jgi:hypothetical protein
MCSPAWLTSLPKPRTVAQLIVNVAISADAIIKMAERVIVGFMTDGNIKRNHWVKP